MKTKENLLTLGFISILYFLSSCTKDATLSSDYPKEIENILVYKCATAGCHNTTSKGAANGIDLSTWEHLFEGGRNGNPVVPYSSEYSYLLYFVNTYDDIGLSLEPVMPQGQAPLTRGEVLTLKNWIEKGAPDRLGNVRFSGNPDRKKIYVANQACDQVAVFDAESRAIMRWVKVGMDDNVIEAPHQVRVSPDGQYWYVLFYSSHIIQKFRTSDDSYMGAVEIGNGVWNTMMFSPDGSKAFVSSLELSGRVAYVNLVNLQKIIDITDANWWPHGTWVSANGNTLYVTSQVGNFIYKIDITDPSMPSTDHIELQTGQPQQFLSSLDPHEIMFTPDESKYFLTCQKSNEVRVMQTSNDSLLAVIPVGAKPQEMSLSKTHPYLFVTCQEDLSQGPGKKGSVAVIDYNTLNVVVPNGIYTGYQPHGIAVDDDHNMVYVANLNYDTGGPAPHHSTNCAGRNGYLSIIDMNTLQLLQISSGGITYNYKNELLPFPYFVSYRK